MHRGAGECLAAVSEGWGMPAPCCHLSKGLQASSRAPAHELLICRGFMTRLGISDQPLHTDSRRVNLWRAPAALGGTAAELVKAGKLKAKHPDTMFLQKKEPVFTSTSQSCAKRDAEDISGSKTLGASTEHLCCSPQKTAQSCTYKRHP